MALAVVAGLKLGVDDLHSMLGSGVEKALVDPGYGRRQSLALTRSAVAERTIERNHEIVLNQDGVTARPYLPPQLDDLAADIIREGGLAGTSRKAVVECLRCREQDDHFRLEAIEFARRVEYLLAYRIELGLVDLRPPTPQFQGGGECLSVMLGGRISEERNPQARLPVLSFDAPAKRNQPMERQVSQFPGLRQVERVHFVRFQ
ncbi:hypothetical protein ABIA44_005643 [Bradyrhizobium sp. USDA 329]